jgi:signal transduction histidine kinase
MSSPADSASELEHLIEALENGVLRIREGKVVSANSALERMLGLPRGEVLGLSAAGLFCDTEGSPISELASMDAVCLRDAHGGLVPASTRQLGPDTYLVLDRTRERRLEGEVWRLSQELRRQENPAEQGVLLGAEMPSMLEHEIRTAITAIRGYLKMLLKEKAGEVNPTQRRFLEEARRATDRISNLLDNLLELTLPDAPDTLRVLRKPVRLHTIVHEAAEAMRPLLDERDIEIHYELEAEDYEVLADPRRMEQVLINLLANAAKFGPKGSVVQIASDNLELDGKRWVCISFQDTGPGVSEEEREQIFQPFVRGRAAAEVSSEGVGLGLAICHKIMQAHGGTIEVVPSPGHGLFRVLLPLAPEGMTA